MDERVAAWDFLAQYNPVTTSPSEVLILQLLCPGVAVQPSLSSASLAPSREIIDSQHGR